jgi:tetratricopeptide (TPR) repeat protein
MAVNGFRINVRWVHQVITVTVKNIIFHTSGKERISLCLFCVCIPLLIFVACDSSFKARGEDALRIEDFDRAIQNFSRALDLDPVDRDARYGLALAYFGEAEAGEKIGKHSLDLWSKTHREFRILSRLDSSHTADVMHSTCLFYLARASVFYNRGAEVLGILDESIALDSTNYYSYNLKGLLLQDLAEYEKAKNIFIFILSRKPDFVSAYSNLGNLYWEEGKIEDAWDIWSMGRNRFPDNHHLSYWTRVAEDSLKSKVLSENP